MPDTTKKLTAEELVKQKYPTAFVDDDGDSVYIQVTRIVKGRCPHCGQAWVRHETDLLAGHIGSGGTEEYAWQSAARSLGLI